MSWRERLEDVGTAPLVFSAIAAAFFIVIGIAIFHDAREHNRLMAACMYDHKEYECVSMLRSSKGGDTVLFIH